MAMHPVQQEKKTYPEAVEVIIRILKTISEARHLLNLLPTILCRCGVAVVPRAVRWYEITLQPSKVPWS